jgi:opacity protein-like surface antigen
VNRVIAVTLAVLVCAGAAQAATVSQPPVSPQVLEKCLNQHGGYLHDNLMVGTPCAPFKNRARVLAVVKNLLVYNGFRPSMTVTKLWARQIGISGIQDGIQIDFLVVKSGRRQIAVVHWTEYGFPVVNRFSVPFDA